VIGVMPDGFGYPVNHDAWAPLPLRASYGALEGGPISVIGRLAPGVTREQADAELRVLGERAAAALPATHVHLRPRVIRLGEAPDFSDIAQLAMTNLPGLLVLILACMNVGTLVYARTATREGEIALRSALGASRGRVIGQLFVEALVLAAIPTAVGLIAADWAGTWKVTRARVQSHLANLGTGGATLRFGRVWTTAMIAQVALTAIAIPGAFESAMQALRNMSIRGEFPSREYLVARLDLDRPSPEEAASAFADRQTRTYGELERRGWGLDSSRHSTAPSSPGVPSTRATAVLRRERSSSTRRSRAIFSATREPGRRSALACAIPRLQNDPTRHRWNRPLPLKLRRTSGSRLLASCATSA
jgi:putative ABC transport system permease protein